ncbi:transketolase, partial [Escherichia coli]
GHDPESIRAAIDVAKSITTMPTLIICKTVIGFGSPHKAGTHDVHGAPLGEAEVAATREALDWPYPPFVILTEIASQWDARKSGQAKEAAWNQQFATYAKAFPELADEFTRRVNGQLPADFASKAQAF